MLPLDADYEYGYDEHIRSDGNPSDAMMTNLPLALFAKHAALISEGLMGNLYDPQTTEDVKIYCATDTMPSVTASYGQYSKRDSNSMLANCSVDHRFEDANKVGWTVVPTKHKRISKNTSKSGKEGKRFFY